MPRVEVERITTLFNAIYDGEAWHGPSINEILDGITAGMAVYRPTPQVHNIAELTVHMTNWRVFALEKLTGSETYDIILNSEADWTRIDSLTPEKWEEIKSNLQDTQEELVETLNRINSKKLSDPVPGRRYTYYILLHGLMEHDIYHSGQLSLLKKMQL
ncbi:MAG: DinB family protein [Siphonobacter sp.]